MRSGLLVLGLVCGLGPAQAFDRRTQQTTLPAAALQRADGQALPLAKAFADGRPVVLTFMFNSCQTVCPITNQTLIELGRLLGPQREKVNLVSISIDPDFDSVRQMADYARRNGHQGLYFTGDPAGAEAVQRAFDTWRGDKMRHEAVFFLSPSPLASKQWLRLSGLVTPRELLGELLQLAPTLRPPK